MLERNSIFSSHSLQRVLRLLWRHCSPVNHTPPSCVRLPGCLPRGLSPSPSFKEGPASAGTWSSSTTTSLHIWVGRRLVRGCALPFPSHKVILSLLKVLFCWNSERGYFEVTPVKALETVMGAWAGSWGHMLHADSSSLLFICRIWTNFSAVIYTTHHLGTSQKCPAGEGEGERQCSWLLAGLAAADSISSLFWLINSLRQSSRNKQKYWQQMKMSHLYERTESLMWWDCRLSSSVKLVIVLTCSLNSDILFILDLFCISFIL